MAATAKRIGNPARGRASALATLLVAPMAALLVIEGINLATVEGSGFRVEVGSALDADILRVMAERRLAANDWSGAAALARRALTDAPLHRKALRTLGFAEFGRGHADVGADVVNLAAQLSWHDPTVELWLFEAGVQIGAFDDAARRADAVARTDGFAEEGFDALGRLVMDEGAVRQVAAQLAAHPSPLYRTMFLASLKPGNVEQARSVALLFATLRRSSSPPTDAEVAPIVGRLIQSGLPELAWRTWRDGVPGSPAGMPLLRDDDLIGSAAALQSGAVRVPFQWSIDDPAARVGGNRDPSGRPALAVEVDPDGAPWVLSRYMLLAGAARYRLRYAFAGPAGMADRVSPRLYCATAKTEPAVARDAPDGLADGYEARSVAFVFPSTCGALRVGFSVGPGDGGGPQSGYLRSVDLRRE